LDDVSTVGNFNCYHVDLYSRTLGKLKSKTFFFRDYLTCPSISYDTSEKIFKFNRSSGTDYLPKPTEKEINSFIEEIEDYLDEIV
jgi:hypothetical protein